MKVIRRRALFHQRPSTNPYRIFLLLTLISLALYLAIGLEGGSVRNPFSPTPTSTRTVNSWRLEAETLFEAGNLNAAISAYQVAVQVEPNNAEIWAELARIQAYSSRLLASESQQLARLGEALASAERAVELAPENARVVAIHAFVLDWYATHPLASTPQKYLNLAEQQALRSLTLDPNNPLALAYYAEILIDQQKWNQAEQYIQRALANGSDLMDVHRVYGYYLESTANYRQAIEEYQAALQINPNLTFLYISIGQNYRTLALRTTFPPQQTALYEQALENFQKAVRLNEQLGIQDPLPYVAIAKTYAQQGQFFAAARNALKAVEIEPANAELYGQLGNIYKRARNYEASILALKCAVRGCTPVESCQVRNGCPPGDPGTTVIGLPLTPGSATYYLDYGSVLSAFSPLYPYYCDEAEDVLSQLIAAYGEDPTVRLNAEVGLNICASVRAQQQPTSLPSPSPTP
ncbi:MAG: tetratricopeptide repeat protein [Anaerolineales bacterium]|nr:tetratricopeptide repeat protein [Anaerolineales bacterium]MCX7607860.1 tetratricopeptide repeat protein [Anaerolineales bacterium]MDW8226871.1 tetratricopeptide repeat protein [Anaerolineales bacterium]